MTTRSTLVSQVESIIDRSDLTSRIQTAFNTVMDRIARRYDDFHVLMDEDTSVTTVVGTFTYTLPSSTNRIYRIVYEDDSNSVDLNEISVGEFDRRYPYPSSLGNSTPSDYCRRSETTIDICHPPSGAKTLRIYRSKFPTHFTADASEPEYIRMDDVLVAGVIFEIYNQLGIQTEADYWYKKFNVELDKAYENDQKKPHMIQKGRGWGFGSILTTDYWKNPWVKGV